MNAPHPKALFENISALPSDRLAEIEDFVDFISARERERALSRAALRASAPVLAAVWDDPENDVYDAL